MDKGHSAIFGKIVALGNGHYLLPDLTTAAAPGIKETGDRLPVQERGGKVSQRVTEFFLQYEKANLSSDASAIGHLYADTFMFGGPSGVKAVKNEDFQKVIPKMKAYMSSLGLCETKLHSVEATPLDSKYLLAKVVWRMKVQNGSKSEYLNALATYVLEQGLGDGLAIVFQIDHQDLANVIKHQQKHQQKSPQ